jgi:hypothetical protein
MVARIPTTASAWALWSSTSKRAISTAPTFRVRPSLSKPSVSIEGKSDYSVEPFTGANGSSTTVSNAMFGFAPTYKIGKGSGHSEAFGLSFDARYGESADFEFSTEMAGEVHPRA